VALADSDVEPEAPRVDGDVPVPQRTQDSSVNIADTEGGKAIIERTRLACTASTASASASARGSRTTRSRRALADVIVLDVLGTASTASSAPTVRTTSGRGLTVTAHRASLYILRMQKKIDLKETSRDETRTELTEDGGELIDSNFKYVTAIHTAINQEHRHHPRS
jgi:hypothetical protein